MIIKQISVFVENKLGRLAQITDIIGKAGIDIRALSIADTSDFGILRVIVDRPDDAIKALKEAGMTVSLTDVIAVGIPDQPGAFSKAVQVMSDAEISIEYMYAFISRTDREAFVILRTEDIDGSVRVLEEKGIKLLHAEDVYHM
ncbi:ACT domain-containing protein [Oscillospiraceae bacterium MB08-C2-2]|nr:ACT domain-containing protein [Oscillospiraceae bacterium MB08-C2-2]